MNPKTEPIGLSSNFTNEGGLIIFRLTFFVQFRFYVFEISFFSRMFFN